MITEKLSQTISEKAAGPFLFLGAGFSRRYIGLESWKALLGKFCVMGKPFGYYYTKSDGDLPKTAKLIAEEFNDHWWISVDYKNSVEEHGDNVKDNTSALRVEICKYLLNSGAPYSVKEEVNEEFNLLKKLNVDGIITTNWDVFIEQIFPDYKIYVGQEQLLFSNPQEIGEIYKIHGCSTHPNSLVLTDEDYNSFHSNNAYLAAKLITIFVEHPIIFVGYSLTDPNIFDLLHAITKCIGNENIEKLRKNLIFVQQANGELESISETYMTIEGIQIPLVLVKTDDYSKVYKAIDSTKRKIPAKVLRICKEQLYELVQSSEPENKLCVIDIDDIDSKDDIEFVVGVGIVKNAHTLSEIGHLGYSSIKLLDVVSDVLHNNKDYDPDLLLTHALKGLIRETKNVPIFKYFRAVGINSIEDYEKSKYKNEKFDKCVYRKLADYKVKQISNSFNNVYKNKNISQIIQSTSPEYASQLIPHMKVADIDMGVLKEFLIENENKITSKTVTQASFFKKLTSYYDRLENGWN